MLCNLLLPPQHNNCTKLTVVLILIYCYNLTTLSNMLVLLFCHVMLELWSNIFKTFKGIVHREIKLHSLSTHHYAANKLNKQIINSMNVFKWRPMAHIIFCAVAKSVHRNPKFNIHTCSSHKSTPCMWCSVTVLNYAISLEKWKHRRRSSSLHVHVSDRVNPVAHWSAGTDWEQ